MNTQFQHELLAEAAQVAEQEGRDFNEIVWDIAERRIMAGEYSSDDYQDIEEAIAAIDFTNIEVITL